MVSASKSTIRSISFPPRSHSATERIEEELNRLKTLGSSSSSAIPTSKTIANCVSRLVDLYKSMVDLLNLPLAMKAICCRQHERCVEDLQDGFMSLLDMCGTARDAVSLVKQHSQDIQSCLRRKKGESDVERCVSNYVSFRKKTNKDSQRMTGMSKQMDNKLMRSPILKLDNHLVSAVIQALRKVVLESFSILRTLLVFLYVPLLKPKQMRWSLVSKLLQLEKCGEGNELQHLDVELGVLCKSDGDRTKATQNSLKSLEGNVESIENGLECLFRGLIKARVSLLNIVSA